MNFIGEKFDSKNPNKFNISWIIAALRSDFKKFIKKNNDWKFLISKGYSGSSITIKIKQFPKTALKSEVESKLSYGNTPDQYLNEDILFELRKIGNAYNYDNSDVQTDYFDKNYYLHLEFYRKELFMVENKIISKIY